MEGDDYERDWTLIYNHRDESYTLVRRQRE